VPNKPLPGLEGSRKLQQHVKGSFSFHATQDDKAAK
jgi:hypothetical protein